MATVNLNVAFDGATDVPRLPGQSAETWSGDFMNFYSVYLVGPDDLDATANLTGSGWTARYLRIAGDDNLTRLQDIDNGTGRRIEHLVLGRNSDVDLTTTQVDFIQGWDGAVHDIRTGSEYIGFISVGATDNFIETGSGFVQSIDVYDGRGEVTATGGVGRINLDERNDVLTVDGGNVEQASLRAGDDIVEILNGGTITNLTAYGSGGLSSGNDQITVSGGGRIDSLLGNEGVKTITLNDSARIFTVKLDNSTNTITTDRGSIETITTYNSSNTLDLGSGGAGTILFNSGAPQSHRITSDGVIGSLTIQDRSTDPGDDQSAEVTLNYFAGPIRLGNGDDVVTTADTDGWVESISTWGGDDVLNLGRDGAGVVQMGAGDDEVVLKPLNDGLPDIFLTGNDGSDTLDFSAFTDPVSFKLWFGGPQMRSAGERGFRVNEFENLVGTVGDDLLVGDETDNRLEGGDGEDRFAGKAGRDPGRRCQ